MCQIIMKQHSTQRKNYSSIFLLQRQPELEIKISLSALLTDIDPNSFLKLWNRERKKKAAHKVTNLLNPSNETEINYNTDLLVDFFFPSFPTKSVIQLFDCYLLVLRVQCWRHSVYKKLFRQSEFAEIHRQCSKLALH